MAPPPLDVLGQAARRAAFTGWDECEGKDRMGGASFCSWSKATGCTVLLVALQRRKP